MSELGLVCVVVAGEEYALRDTAVRRIGRLDQLDTTQAADERLGTLNIDGYPAPVHLLAHVFGPSRAAAVGRHIVVVDGPVGPIGWIVDGVRRVRQTVRRPPLPLPRVTGPRARAWFEGVLELDEGPLLLIAARSLGPSRETATGRVEHGAGGRPPATEPGQALTAPLVVTFATTALPDCEGTRFAVSARQLAGVASALEPVRVPGSPAYVTGVAVWQGEATAVVDFRSSNRHAKEGRAGRHLVARTGPRCRTQPVAFRVDADVRLHRPTADDCQSPARTARPPFVVGFFDAAGTRLALIDLGVLVGD